MLQKHQKLDGIDVSFLPSESISSYISRLLDAHQTNPSAVLRHLVGAKLELRFSNQPVSIAHHSSGTMEIQAEGHVDFEIGSTVFHVTKSVNDSHFRAAKQNINKDRKVYFLVPDNVVLEVKEYAERFEKNFSKKVNIFSVEQFLVQNLDELAVFDKNEAHRKLRLLLKKYNELIDIYEDEPWTFV